MTTTTATRAAASINLLGATRGAGGRAALALVLDAVLIAVPTTIAVLAFRDSQPVLAWSMVATAVALLFMILIDFSRTGRSFGSRICGVRTVAVHDALPLRWRLFSARRTVDIRYGRDPLSPALDAFNFPEPRTVPSRPATASRAIVELDTGEQLTVNGTLVVGRAGEGRQSGPGIFAWHDISRTLSQTHIRLEWDGHKLWLTDLGSRNGTFLEGAGGATSVFPPFQRTALAPMSIVRMGSRRLRVKVSE